MIKITLAYAMPVNEPDEEIFERDQSQYQVSCTLHEFIRMYRALSRIALLNRFNGCINMRR